MNLVRGIRTGDKKAVEKIVENGFDLFQFFEEGNSALQIAYLEFQTEIFDYLVETYQLDPQECGIELLEKTFFSGFDEDFVSQKVADFSSGESIPISYRIPIPDEGVYKDYAELFLNSVGCVQLINRITRGYQFAAINSANIKFLGTFHFEKCNLGGEFRRLIVVKGQLPVERDKNAMGCIGTMLLLIVFPPLGVICLLGGIIQAFSSDNKRGNDPYFVKKVEEFNRSLSRHEVELKRNSPDVASGTNRMFRNSTITSRAKEIGGNASS